MHACLFAPVLVGARLYSGWQCCLRAYIGVCAGLGKESLFICGGSAAFFGAYVLLRVFACLWVGVWLFFGGRLVARWVIMLLGLVFARVFISVFSWGVLA